MHAHLAAVGPCGPDLRKLTFDHHWVASFKTPGMACGAKMALEAYKIREPEMVREVFAACMRISDGICPEAPPTPQ